MIYARQDGSTEVLDEKELSMPYCKHCGNVLKPQARFCEHDGRPVVDPGSPPTAEAGNAGYQPALSPGVTAPPTASASKNAGRIAAIIVLIGFFMPWISCGGQRMSGIELASHGAPGLWIIPLSMLVALGVLLNKGKSVQERATAAKIVIGGALASVIVMVYYWARLNGIGERDEYGLGGAMRQAFTIQIGAIISFFASIGLAISGFIHNQPVSQSRGQPPG
jgi:hypothetical protein